LEHVTNQSKHKSVEENIAHAMDCTDTSLVPFLPYILQDFVEMGSSAASIVEIVKNHTRDHPQLDILDVGCGKGAVAIALADELNCTCCGIDAVPEFIDTANTEAGEKGMADRCVFICGDVREIIHHFGHYNVIVLGSVGPIWGDYFETLIVLKSRLNPEGLIILDDGYLEDEPSVEQESAIKKSALLGQIERAGMILLQEYRGQSVSNSQQFEIELAHIQKRCTELGIQYPAQKQLFDGYIKKQKQEYDHLENDIICATLVLGAAANRR